MSFTSFLDLSGELRNEIYSYLTPINGRPKDFIGLVFSCKQVHQEALGVINHEMNKFKDDLEKSCTTLGIAPVTISRTTTYRSLRIMDASVPRYYYTPSLREKLGECLRAIAMLHLDRINVDFYENVPAEQDKADLHMKQYSHEELGILRHLQYGEPAVRKIRVASILLDLYATSPSKFLVNLRPRFDYTTGKRIMYRD